MKNDGIGWMRNICGFLLGCFKIKKLKLIKRPQRKSKRSFINSVNAKLYQSVQDSLSHINLG